MKNFKQQNFFKETNVENFRFLEMCENLEKYDDDTFVKISLEYFRRNGFPHYKIAKGEHINIMYKLLRFSHLSLLDGDVINQSMHGLRLAWTYFPHFWGIKCGKSKYTALDVFNDDKLFSTTLKKSYKYCLKYENGKVRLNRIRQLLKKYNGVQTVSNFRPTAAKVIYELFSGNGVVWDMSSGWGGRLLGALSSYKIKKYIGTEPSTKTYNGLLKMKDDFSYLKKEIEIYKEGSEVFKPDKNSLDLCFTSPPYFDTEKYSNESTQSYIKYPNEKDWIDGFLTSTIENCYYGLKKDSYMVLNIAKTNNAKNVEDDLIEISKKIGFDYIKTLKLYLSAINGAGAKFEPIYIFKKREKK